MTAWNTFLPAEAISMQAGLMRDCVSFAKSLECLVELMIPICSHQVTILRIGLSSRINSGKGKDLNHGKKNSADTHKKAAEKELPSSLMNKWFNRGRQVLGRFYFWDLMKKSLVMSHSLDQDL